MSGDNDEPGVGALSPDEAFAVLGDETRMAILQALAGADGPLPFSELRDRVGVSDSGRFNYHLDRLEGHFVGTSGDRYRLRQPGRRVIAAVRSGAVTDTPVVEPTPIDASCPLCGAPSEVAFHQGRVEHYCPDCAGYYGRVTLPAASPLSSGGATEYGYLGSFELPPAGTQGRTPGELFQAATTWGLLSLVAVASGVCPHCSAPLDRSTRVCEDHDTADDHCSACDNRHAIQLEFRCSNCLYGGEAAFAVALLADVEVLAFLAGRGINPVAPSDPTVYSTALMDYEEELCSVDPFEAQFTLTADGDALTVVVDEAFTVVEATVD